MLPKMILPQCVAAGQLVGVASFESTKQLIPAEKLAVTLPVFLGIAPPLPAGTVPSGMHRIRPDFSPIH